MGIDDDGISINSIASGLFLLLDMILSNSVIDCTICS